MASRIKGITVEIGGDTTGLTECAEGSQFHYQESTQSCIKGCE